MVEAGLIATGTITGLVLGSFLNVVIYRTPRGLSVVSPGSACPDCSTPIRPLDNVPLVSWLLLGGRCRSCRRPISARYPLVEAGTAALLSLLAWVTGPTWALPGLWILAATLLAAGMIDIDHLEIPPSVSAIGTAIGGSALGTYAVLSHHWARLAGMGAGLALALLVVAVALANPPPRMSAPRVRGRVRAHELRALAVSFVPGATLLGWSGPLGAAAGLSLGISSYAASAAGMALLARRRSQPHPAELLGEPPGPARVPIGALVATASMAGVLIGASLHGR
ncbi:MAG: prepilin peptidase [Acidimicrobiales bacterium]